METLEQLKEIFKNAPEGATHYDEEGDYIKCSDEFLFWYDDFEWSALETYVAMRSLSDIKDKIELLENKQKLLEKINQFDKAITDIGKHI